MIVDASEIEPSVPSLFRSGLRASFEIAATDSQTREEIVIHWYDFVLLDIPNLIFQTHSSHCRFD